jgi:hypothetical protein
MSTLSEEVMGHTYCSHKVLAVCIYLMASVRYASTSLK